jgi:hypothetical protein
MNTAKAFLLFAAERVRSGILALSTLVLLKMALILVGDGPAQTRAGQAVAHPATAHLSLR